MKIKWLVQDVGLNQSQLYRKFEALSFLGEEFSNIGVIANYPYISGLSSAVTDIDTVYVLLCGVKVLNMLKSAKTIADVIEYPTQFQIDNERHILDALICGVFYDYTKFDQKYYGQLGLPLLNSAASYIALRDNLETSFAIDKFVKPTRDLKAFDAGILKAQTTLGDFVLSKSRQSFYLEECIVVSDVVDIIDEYRFFVVNGNVVTGSAYRLNRKVQQSEIVPVQIYNTAREYCTLYEPHSIFTMDLAVLNDGSVKIIEYNCFNCSGSYLCDLVLTFKAIKSFLLGE